MNTGVGRFTQKDPSRFESNAYLYAGANPITNVDPSGLWFCIGHPECEDWIKKALINLSKIKPEGSQIFKDFNIYDGSIIPWPLAFIPGLLEECNGMVIGIGYMFVVAPLDGKNFAMETRPGFIRIAPRYMAKPPEKENVSILGHELFHAIRQRHNVFLAISIQGELQAAQFQARLDVALGLVLEKESEPLNLRLNYVKDLDTWRKGRYADWQPYAPPFTPLIGRNGEQCSQGIIPHSSYLHCERVTSTIPTSTPGPPNPQPQPQRAQVPPGTLPPESTREP